MKLIGLALGILLVLLAALEVVATRAARGDSASPPMRFDRVVRDDFFEGLRGNAARLDNAMKRCEEELAKDPRHAQALVWHGSGLTFRAGQAARRGDLAAAGELIEQGRKEMNDAVAIAPGDTVVLLLRGVTLSRASAGVGDRDLRVALLRTAVGDYETTLGIQKEIFAQLSVHARGELLGALAESWQRLGDDAKSRAYLTRIVAEVPFSPYAETAEKWLTRKPAAGEGLTCLGCHGD